MPRELRTVYWCFLVTCVTCGVGIWQLAREAESVTAVDWEENEDSPFHRRADDQSP